MQKSIRHVTRNVLGQGSFLGIRGQHEKEIFREKFPFIFSQETLKNCTLNEIFNSLMTVMKVFFPKLGHLFPISGCCYS